MPNKAKLLSLSLAASIACFTAIWAQQSEPQEGLTARDMFRKAAGRLVPAPANAPAPEPPKRNTLAQATGTAKPPSASPKTGTGTPKADLAGSKTDNNTLAKAEPPKTNTPQGSSASHTSPATGSHPPTNSSAKTNNGAQVILASTQSQAPLGLRYSLLKQTPNGETVEVDADTVFRSGERIRITVATTETAYVYVVNRGSSGKWRVLFPSQEIGNGSNLLQGGMIYQIPAGHWFAFDEQVGVENLFVMVSRTPEQDLDSLIYQIKEGGNQQDPTLLMAANIPPVDDDLISHLRSEVYARDLVFEKVDDKPKATSNNATMSEKAVYVVNKTGSDDSRVTADIKLKHQ